MGTQGFDPIELGRRVEAEVCRRVGGAVERRYYRFRGGRWYGGISTADCVGCNLRCRFCWSWRAGSHVTRAGTFRSAEDVAARLLRIARSRGYRLLRVSGGEPTLCSEHLLDLLGHLEGTGYDFVLETNGILIGYDAGFARKLASFRNLIVRVSLKGACREEFSRITGAREEFFDLQLRAIERLVEYGMEAGERVYPAVMLSFSSPESVKALMERLHDIHPELPGSVDPEVVILYPHVKELLRRYGLRPLRAVDPDRIPDYMI